MRYCICNEKASIIYESATNAEETCSLLRLVTKKVAAMENVRSSSSCVSPLAVIRYTSRMMRVIREIEEGDAGQ